MPVVNLSSKVGQALNQELRSPAYTKWGRPDDHLISSFAVLHSLQYEEDVHASSATAFFRSP
jgi:hypothetical protein